MLLCRTCGQELTRNQTSGLWGSTHLANTNGVLEQPKEPGYWVICHEGITHHVPEDPLARMVREYAYDARTDNGSPLQADPT